MAETDKGTLRAEAPNPNAETWAGAYIAHSKEGGYAASAEQDAASIIGSGGDHRPFVYDTSRARRHDELMEALTPEQLKRLEDNPEDAARYFKTGELDK
jgi:hypothetical protein